MNILPAVSYTHLYCSQHVLQQLSQDAESQDHNSESMIHHWLYYWRWSWVHLWLWVPYRQKCDGPSVITQQSQHKFCRNSSHVQFIGQMSCTVILYDCATISQTLWIIRLRSARIVPWTLAMVSGFLLVDSHAECSLLSTDVLLSLRHTTKRFCFDSWHYHQRV